MLPGNHRGLSGSATAHTVVLDRPPTAAVYLFTLNFLPPRKEALGVPKADPFFWELYTFTTTFHQSSCIHSYNASISIFKVHING